MQFSRGRTRTRNVILNVTPLIDVLLVLIIFFLMATTFVLAPGIKVDLPQASAVHQAQENDALVVITQDGTVYYQDQPVDLQALQATLSQARQQQPELRLVIRADKGVAHGRVVEVMDTAKVAGVDRLAISTAPRKAVAQ
jgi:biopolymer transport protein ExbD